MIHKKGGRIRTYGRPAPDLLGWVAGLAPLVAPVPETDALRYPARNLVSPTPLLAFQLAIVPEIAISPSSFELVLGPEGNGVTKSSLLLQLDHCSTRWVTSSGLPGKLLFFFQELVGGMDT
ncbi:hypothetical protein DEO72_LG9g629 [Vigna unguiculata]|uniref:Uncharacterized protein n=1 Tax=Vigna unguiculata TaxID=3917 RepID=A0A4D6N0I6_VIGUN|nr:hypothetical protein DEO72_LG9g629 [Vigna unguiculata]